MGGAPNDRDEKDDAPEPSRNPWVTWMVWLVVATVLYLLSTGPMHWLVKNHYLTEKEMVIYQPLNYLPSNFKPLFDTYYDWWLN